MCAGGQDIPVTLRVAGGVEGGKWKSEEDVRATPQPEEEVETTETTETTEVPEPVGPSTPLYQPVIDRINKLSEKLPDEVADETVQEMHPMMHHGWGMNDRNHANTMQMLDQIMRNTSRRPRPPRPGGPGKWGGGKRNPHNPQIRPPQTLGTNPQVAGLAGLFAGPQREQVMPAGPQLSLQPQQGIPVPQMGTQMPMPMQSEVMEEQQMEILGQPKQFANGGIVNALMATPVGQAALRQYATGGEIGEDVEAEQVLEHTPTGATIEDILAGRATFFNPFKYRHGEVISDISDTLGVPIKKKKVPTIEYQDSEGGSPPPHDTWSGTNWQGDYVTLQDKAPGQNIHDPTYHLDKLNIPNIVKPGGFIGAALEKIVPSIEKAVGYTPPQLTIPDPDKPFDPNQWNIQDRDAKYLQLDKRAEDRRKAPEVYAPDWDAKKASDDLKSKQTQDRINQYTLSLPTTSERKGAGTGGVGGIHSPPPDLINYGTKPGVSGSGPFGTPQTQPIYDMKADSQTPTQTVPTPTSPAQSVVKSTEALINYGKTAEELGPQVATNITGIDDKSLADAQNPLSDPRGHVLAQGFNIYDPDRLGLQSMAPDKAKTLWGLQVEMNPNKAKTLWSEQFGPEKGKDSEKGKSPTPGVGSQTLHGGTPTTQNTIDPLTFDIFGGGLSALGSIIEQQKQADITRSQTELARNIARDLPTLGTLTPAQTQYENWFSQVPEGYDYTGTDPASIDVQSMVDSFSDMPGHTDLGGGMDDSPAGTSDAPGEEGGWDDPDQGMYE